MESGGLKYTVKDWMSAAASPVNYDPADPLSPQYAQLVATYADEKGSRSKSQQSYIEACLRTRQLIYWKKSIGDCGQPSKISSNTGVGLGLKFASTGISSYVGVGTALAQTLPASAGELGALPALSILGPIGLGVGLVAGVVTAIQQHHTAAVAKQDSVCCDVASFWNSAAAQIFGGQIQKVPPQAVKQIASQIQSALKSIMKRGDFPWWMNQTVQALRDLTLFIISNPNAVQTSASSNPSPISGTGGVVVAGAAVLGAHFLGAF